MNWRQSFRWRILLGTILWNVGADPSNASVVPGGARPASFHTWVGHRNFSRFCDCVHLGGNLAVPRRPVAFWPFTRQLLALRDGSRDRIEGILSNRSSAIGERSQSLLEHRERIVRRALAKAGDLAHGLKTPLAVLAQEAEQFEASGQHEIASTISPTNRSHAQAG